MSHQDRPEMSSRVAPCRAPRGPRSDRRMTEQEAQPYPNEHRQEDDDEQDRHRHEKYRTTVVSTPLHRESNGDGTDHNKRGDQQQTKQHAQTEVSPVPFGEKADGASLFRTETRIPHDL